MGVAGQDPDAMAFISGLAAGVPLSGSPALTPLGYGQDLASQLGAPPPPPHRRMPMDLASALSAGSAGSDGDGSVHLHCDLPVPQAPHLTGDCDNSRLVPDSSRLLVRYSTRVIQLESICTASECTDVS